MWLPSFKTERFCCGGGGGEGLWTEHRRLFIVVIEGTVAIILWTLLPWRWSHCDLSKHQKPLSQRRSVTSRKNEPSVIPLWEPQISRIRTFRWKWEKIRRLKSQQWLYVTNALCQTLFCLQSTFTIEICLLKTLILLTWRIWWAPNNDSRWKMGFKSAFKGKHFVSSSSSSSSSSSFFFFLLLLFSSSSSLLLLFFFFFFFFSSSSSSSSSSSLLLLLLLFFFSSSSSFLLFFFCFFFFFYFFFFFSSFSSSSRLLFFFSSSSLLLLLFFFFFFSSSLLLFFSSFSSSFLLLFSSSSPPSLLLLLFLLLLFFSSASSFLLLLFFSYFSSVSSAPSSLFLLLFFSYFSSVSSAPSYPLLLFFFYSTMVPSVWPCLPSRQMPPSALFQALCSSGFSGLFIVPDEVEAPMPKP